MSKRRRGFPSETRVKRGRRIVGGSKELEEKLGRNDLCPCGSGKRFQALLHGVGPLRRLEPRLLLSGSSGGRAVVDAGAAVACRGVSRAGGRRPSEAGAGPGGSVTGGGA
ncbi:MAG: SEC-C metal-binding domain-containing protein [Planctomycetota bacterium]